MRTDKVALAAIYQVIPDEILLYISEKKSAKDSWDAIKTMCIGADRVQKVKVQTLKAEFQSMNMKELKNLDDEFFYEDVWAGHEYPSPRGKYG